MASPSDPILIERREDGVALVTLNRPERRNAVTLAMWRDLAALYRDFSRDAAVRAVILTGTGGQFSAGADISEFEQVRATREQGEAYAEAVDTAEDAIAELPCPSVAAVEGYCIGGGLGLALSCDFRIAGAGSSMAIPAARLGIVYGAKETRALLCAVGMAGAKRILFAGERITAEEAERMGLVDERVEDGGAREAALALAGRLARNAPLSIAGAKLVLREIAEPGHAPDQAAIAAAMRRAQDSEDYREAVRAFAEKRPPRFTGR